MSDSLQLHHHDQPHHINEDQYHHQVEAINHHEKKIEKHEKQEIHEKGVVSKPHNKDHHHQSAKPKPASSDHHHHQKKPMGPPKFTRSQIREIFEEHDVDGDGYLNLSELVKAFSFLGSILPFFKAHYGLNYADADGDGLIDEEELEKLIDYVEKVSKRKGGF